MLGAFIVAKAGVVAGLQERHRNVRLLRVNPSGLIVLGHVQRVAGLSQFCPLSG